MEINFKDFKDRVRESLAGKAYHRLEEIYKEFSSNIFEDNEEDFEEYPNHGEEVQGPGGEFLVDLEFEESDTKLKNFRIVAINKEDALSRLNNMFGKKSFKVTKIELTPNYDYKKTDKMLGRVVKESEEIHYSSNLKNEKLEQIFIRPLKSSEKANPSSSKHFNKIPDKEGWEKVYKPYGEKGKGYYYQRNFQESLEEEKGYPRTSKKDFEEITKKYKTSGRKLKGIMTDPTYNATDPKNTSSFKSSEPVSEDAGIILKKILKNK